MKSFQTEHVLNLPDAFRKDTQSNNYKILQVERLTVNELRETLAEINSILDINNATGKTLDLYGEREGQARGLASDEQYLLMIKSKIMQNVANGSYKSIVDSLCVTLGCEPSEVYIVEGDEPCVVNVIMLPLDGVVYAGLTINQTLALINRLLPVGVVLESYVFEGTFEFGNEEFEYDEKKGFAEFENATAEDIGGYLGLISGEENEPILPI